ncbi:MAG TPA: hypothetical protein ENK18_20155 [Deltaproteobacteria bacterium]|nr:hypothetical protein [Deltaproteobacteria bacterium]
MLILQLASIADADTCGEGPRELLTSEIPLGPSAIGGRLAALAVVDVDGDGVSELHGAVVPPLDATQPLGLWSTHPDASGVHQPGLVQPMHDLSVAGLHLLPGDLDGDGDMDLALIDPVRNEVTQILSLGEGFQISPPHSLQLGPGPSVGDLDGDGVSELLSATLLGSARAWSLRSSEPELKLEGTVPEGVVAQAVGDLDGDGAPEWIFARGTSSRLAVAWGGDLRRREDLRIAVADARDLVAMDRDQDGEDELFVVDRRRAGVRLLTSPRLRRGPWVVRLKQDGARDSPQSLSVADVDGDGCLDVVLHSFATHELAVAWGDDQGRFSPQWIPGAGAGPVAVGQLDDRPGLEIAVVSGEVVRLFGIAAAPEPGPTAPPPEP